MTGLIACAQPPEAPSEPPRLVFQETTHQLEPVQRGGTVRHDFHFLNAGGLDLSIGHLRSGCGCTAMLLSRGPVRPGAAGIVRTTCETATLFGPFRRTTTVYSNDPTQQVTVLTLAGDVIADVVVDPPALYVGHVHRGQRVQRELAATASGGPVAVETDATVLTIEPTGSSHGDRAQRFVVVVADHAPVGPLDQTIRIRPGGNRLPVEVSVIGVVDEDVTVSPAQIDLGRIDQHSTVVRHLLVQTGGPSPAHLISAEWEPLLGRTEIDAMSAGARYRVRLSLDPELPPGVLDGAVVLTTDHPQQSVIRVPVSAEILAVAAAPSPAPSLE